MNGYVHDGLVFGVEFWRFLVGTALLVLGFLVIGCGVNACWLRFGRRPPQ